ncbi:MAG: hypothetical protein HZB31_07550 [Nitrospirae bacterium]|nr:hypothetical protein [Nitrospirota bacterium]
MHTGNIFGISVSALSAYLTRLNVTANNVANMNTEGFKPSNAMLNTMSDGGVSATIRQLDVPEVDLAGEMVDLIVTEIAFKANIKAIRMEDEITGSILDIKG